MLRVKIEVKPTFTLEITEEQAKAIGKLAEYGPESIATALGKTVSSDFEAGGKHRKGIERFFQSIRGTIKPHMERLDRARIAADGEFYGKEEESE